MSEIVPFLFEGEQIVRVVIRDDEPWFVAADVCAVLGHRNARQVVSRLDDDEKGVQIVDTLGGPQEMAIINESGLYALILTSRKPQAKRFRKWVAAEVLTSIRRTGGYRTRREEASANPAADQRRQNQSWVLMNRLNKTTDPEQRRFLYAMLEAVSQDMGLTAPPITSLGREARQQPDLLTPFWARIEGLLAAGAAINHARAANMLALRLLDLRERHGMEIDSDLREALKLLLSPRFIGQRAVNSALTGTTVKCWLFARTTAPAGGEDA